MNQHDQMIKALEYIAELCDYAGTAKRIKEVAEQALVARPDQTQCPVCEGDAVKQVSYVCKNCGADFADAQCNRENIESWHRKPMVRLTDDEIWKLWHELPQPTAKYAIARFAEEVMDALEVKNK